MTRKQFKKAVIANFKKKNPTWTPEHGPDELDNVLHYMLEDGELTLKTKPGRAANLLAAFIAPL